MLILMSCCILSSEGLDYRQPTGQYFLSSGATRDCLDLRILNDNFFEFDEFLDARLTGLQVGGVVVSSVRGVDLDPTEALIQILDDDGII